MLFLEKLESQPLSRSLRESRRLLLSDLGGPRLKREGWHIFYKRHTGREPLASRELEELGHPHAAGRKDSP